MAKSYPGYKSGTNSRGLPSKEQNVPEVTNEVYSKQDHFVQACKRATEKRAEEPRSGRHRHGAKRKSKLRSQRGRNKWMAGLKKDQIQPTKRQASKFRNKHGAAYEARGFEAANTNTDNLEVA